MSFETDIMVLVVLIVLSGFFSGIETAFFSLSKLRVRHLVEQKKRGAKTVEKMKEHPRKILITILICNNLVNIGASVFATGLGASIFKSNVVGYVTGIMTFIILLFGEITPKALATTHGEFISLLVARPLLLLSYILYPFVIFFELISSLITSIFGKGTEKPLVTEEEIKTIIQVGEEEGEIDEYEKEMINNIFEFGDIIVEKIMTHRKFMVTRRAGRKVKDELDFFIKTPHTRIPLFERNRDNILGVVHQRDIFKALKEGKTETSLRELMKDAFFVPETLKIDALLKQFQKRKQHIAIVVDEHGSVTGLVTIEDILEEIVGEIEDETDKVELNIIEIGKNEYRVLGKTDIEDINDKLDIDIEKTEEFDTLSGLIMSKSGKIPTENQIIRLPDCRIIVEKIVGNTVETARIKIKKKD